MNILLLKHEQKKSIAIKEIKRPAKHRMQKKGPSSPGEHAVKKTNFFFR